jgi:hypothetical protein
MLLMMTMLIIITIPVMLSNQLLLIETHQNHKIFFSLLFFVIGIEDLQELSNHISTKKIHGNFDPVDVFYNVMGLPTSRLFQELKLF